VPNDDDAPPTVFVIPAEIYDAMIAHCVGDAPNEACGILSGSEATVDAIHPMKNVAERPRVRYLADSEQTVAILRRLRDEGSELLAIYHSHPASPAVPSKADLKQNGYAGLPRIIVSLAEPEPVVRIWRLGESAYHELPWRVGVEPDGVSA
jgi:[CysO sulfur-carrier protein]-S-L-cysteine hydrolase